MISADFHIHALNSGDSLLKPRSLLKIAEKKGLSVVAVTDHNTLSGGFQTIKEARNIKSNILIIPGMEISTDRGHLLALFIQDNIVTRSYQDVLDQIKRQDGIAVIPHPCKKSQKYNDAEFAKADLLEGYNGRATSKENVSGMNLCKRLNKTVIGGSDAHFSFEVGRVRTILPRNPTSIDEVKKMLLNGSILGIETHVNRISPYVMHALSCSTEICRRLIF